MARRFGIPQPALLVLGGAALALVPGLPRPGLDSDVIFLVFVPPLIYYGSTRAPLREFTQQIKPIVLLSVVLEGEGIFNDATALVAYRIALAAAVTGTFSLRQATGELAWSGSLGVALGILTGWGIIAIRRRMQDLPLVDNSISLLTPFAAYVPAEALGGSGVLAVVAAGIYIGQHLSTTISPAARVQSGATWAMVAFILENLVFILIGLELPYLLHDTRATSLGTFLRCSAVVSLVVILARIACVLPAAYARRVLAKRRSRRGSWKQTIVLAWTGVRGAETVVIALALPHITAAGTRLPGRNLTIFISFGVVFATLVLQGLTIGPLIRLLGLHGDQQPAREEAHARHVIATEGLRRLEDLVRAEEAPLDIVHELRQRHERRRRHWATRERRLGGEPIGPHDVDPADDGRGEAHSLSYRRLRAAMLDSERELAVKLRDQGVIGADVLRRIERDLDLEIMLLGDFAPDELAHATDGPNHRQ